MEENLRNGSKKQILFSSPPYTEQFYNEFKIKSYSNSIWY